MFRTTRNHRREANMPATKQLDAMFVDPPGEAAKLTSMLGDEHINIEAMSIQDAGEYLPAFYEAQRCMGRRVAPSDYYETILKESPKYTMIGLITDTPDEAMVNWGNRDTRSRIMK
jgi:hypothetical protein